MEPFLTLPNEYPALKADTKTAQAFRTIARGRLYPPRMMDCRSAYQHLQSLFGLTDMELDALALLLTRRIGQRPCEYRRFLSCSEKEAAELWRLFFTKGYVIEAPCEDQWDSAIVPSPWLEKAIREDRPMAEIREEAFMDAFSDVLKNLVKEPEDRFAPRPQTVLEDPSDTDDLDGFFNIGSSPKKPVTDCRTADETKLLLPLRNIEKVLQQYAETGQAARVREMTSGLDKYSQLVFFFLMGIFLVQFTKPVHLGEFPSRFIAGESFKKNALLSKSLGCLIEKELAANIYVWDREDKTSGSYYYRISHLTAALFKGRENVINKQTLVEYARYVPPTGIDERQLFFSECDARNIDRIRMAALPSEYGRIIKEFKAEHLRPCLSVLMFGPPGTGKTELARQIARSTGRALLIADASKLEGIYIGESEINYREFFQTYRYVCAVSELCPILLLDEADGLMGTRISEVQSTSDKHSNTVQNVILEELNTLPGLFIATTNLLENMDAAMFRRFMIKAEFHLPDEKTRKEIWLSKMPSLSPADAATLAQRIPLSGGLIDNVVSEAIVDKILYKKPITLDDLIGYCQSQQVNGKAQERKRIGF